MILNPPFHRFEFSLSRNIELYSGETNDMDFSYYLDDYFIGKINQTLHHTDVHIVGAYSKEYPFFIETKKENSIYTLDPNYSIDKLAPIANSIESLYKICTEIKNFIETCGPENPILKDVETVNTMKKIIRDFEIYSPNCYTRFWMERPMGELLIGLEL